MCSSKSASSFALSQDVYSAGEFEFEILPSMVPGIITTFGFTSEGLVSNPTYFEIVFDSVRYGD
jgi:hypothetical protein